MTSLIARWFIGNLHKRSNICMDFTQTWFIKWLMRMVAAFSLAILLCACGNLSETPLPTLIPAEQLPTVIALTLSAGQAAMANATTAPALTPVLVTATKVPTPTRTRYPTRTPTDLPTRTITPPPSATATGTPLPTETPTASITPLPVIPNAVIRFNKPAPLSRVTSPIQVEAYVRTPPDGVFRLELLGENGRIIARKVLSAPQHVLNLSTELEFGISGVAEAGRLQIVTYDQYGRIINLNSADVVLLSIGPADLPYSIDTLERVMIEAPARNAEIKGNVVTVYGKARPGQEKPYLIELINSSGFVVGSRQVFVTPEPGEGYGAFLVDVPYNVSQPTQVRLTISVKGNYIPGPAYAISREITVGP